MSEPIEKVILVSKVEDTGDKIAVFDENNKKFTFFKQWQGQNTDGYNSFLMLNVGFNSLVKIVYVEKQGEFKGKPVTYRNIYRFEAATQGQVAAKPPFITPSEIAKKEADRTDGMIRHGLVCALIQRYGAIDKDVVSQIEQILIPYIKTGKFNDVITTKTIDGAPEIDDSDIPF